MIRFLPWLRRSPPRAPEPERPRYRYTFTGHDEAKAVAAARRASDQADQLRRLHANRAYLAASAPVDPRD